MERRGLAEEVRVLPDWGGESLVTYAQVLGPPIGCPTADWMLQPVFLSRGCPDGLSQVTLCLEVQKMEQTLSHLPLAEIADAVALWRIAEFAQNLRSENPDPRVQEAAHSLLETVTKGAGWQEAPPPPAPGQSVGSPVSSPGVTNAPSPPAGVGLATMDWLESEPVERRPAVS